MRGDGNGSLRPLPFRQRHQINDDVSHLREFRRLRHEELARIAAVVRKNWRCAFRSGLSPNNQALDGTFPSEYS
jgi:hypothetical protein